MSSNIPSNSTGANAATAQSMPMQQATFTLDPLMLVVTFLNQE
jgi:hypothetical protein